MKIIGIVGAIYCGSTIVSRLLSSLPGVIAPGEIEQILQHGWPICQNCGGACDLFTEEFVKSCTRKNIYEKLSEAYGGADVLVSSDKNTESLLRYSQRPSHVIMLSRDPVQHAVSISRTQGTEEQSAIELVTFYQSQINLLSIESIPYVHMRMEAFLDDPTGAVHWLAQQGIVPDGIPQFPPTFHHCLGNFDAVISKKVDKKRPFRHTPTMKREEIERLVAPLDRTFDYLPVPQYLGRYEHE